MTRITSQLAHGGGALALLSCLLAPAVASAQATPVLPTPLPGTGTPTRAVEPAQAPAPAAPPAVIQAPAPTGRDPFNPLVTKPVAPETPGAVEQRQPLSGLKLVGVIWDAKNRDQIRALVETPDGLGYYVRLNEEKFGAKVVGIDRDRVRFSVSEQIPGGPVRVRTVELKLGGQ